MVSRPIVLVTGAAKRVGRSIAIRLAREGFQVAIHYNKSREEAESAAAECGGAELFQANLSNVPDILRMFSEIEQRLGRLDCLVNNAARFTKIEPLNVTEADWDFIHSVNLKSVFFCCQQAARIMMKQESGRIVNISSLGGIRPWPDHAHYCAAKAGVIHMTRALAVAWAPKITVNSVAPGVIPFGEEKTNSSVQELIAKTPARRQGSGDEIATAVLQFLRASEYVTGQTLAVDGGLGLV